MTLYVVSDIFGYPLPRDCLSKDLPLSPVGHLALNKLCERPDRQGEALHHYLFTDGGIKQASNALKHQFSDGDIGLGYSAGGTALWLAATQQPSLSALVCVSSTRLRQLGPIPVPNHVFFGELDTNRPPQCWLSDVPDRVTILPQATHTYYQDSQSAAAIETVAEIRNLIGST